MNFFWDYLPAKKAAVRVQLIWRTWFECSRENASVYSGQEMSTTSAGITSVPDSADIYLDLAERDILRVKLQPHRREERGFSFLHRVVVEKPPGARFTLLKCNLLEVSFCSEFSICTSSLVKAESISADSICSRCPIPSPRYGRSAERHYSY